MNEINKIRIKIALIPLFILASIIFSLLPLDYMGIFSFFKIMPLVLFIIAFTIFLIGAMWDFGASNYLKDLMAGKGELKDEDITYINKQQLIMTLIFIGDGLIYMLVGYIIFLL